MGFYIKNGGLIGIGKIADKRGVYDQIASQIIGDSLFPFSSHSFTNASTTGKNGPTLSACQTAYSGAAFLASASYFSVTNGIQRWTVPASGTYTFTIRGAGGGNGYTNGSSNNVGGFGRILTGSIQLTKGDQIDILIGQQGTDGNPSSSCGGGNGGGGGGTFVYNVTTSTLLLVAGGGGGGSTWTGIDSGTGVNLQHASGTNDGLDSLGTPSNPTGGSNGGGGTGSNGYGCVSGAGGGGGFSGDGTYGYSTNDYGKAFNNATNPGQGGTTSYREGGFGGGGGSGYYTAGGGGGYSGGAGGGLPSCSCSRLTAGGGGGSYYNSTFVTLTSNIGASSQTQGIFTLTV